VISLVAAKQGQPIRINPASQAIQDKIPVYKCSIGAADRHARSRAAGH